MSAPGDRGPDALVKVIPPDFGDELKPRNQTRQLKLAGQIPADRERIERSEHPPTDGFKDRPCMCLCSAEHTHPACLLGLPIIRYHAGTSCLPVFIQTDHATP